MINKIFCETKAEEYYQYLTQERKEQYQEFYHSAACCPEEYIISVDIAHPHIKDQCCVIKYNYQEYLKGNIVVEEVKYF